MRMTKKNKLSTPEWILKGHDSPEEYEKSKGNEIKHRLVYPKEGQNPKVRNQRVTLLKGILLCKIKGGKK